MTPGPTSRWDDWDARIKGTGSSAHSLETYPLAEVAGPGQVLRAAVGGGERDRLNLPLRVWGVFQRSRQN